MDTNKKVLEKLKSDAENAEMLLHNASPDMIDDCLYNYIEAKQKHLAFLNSIIKSNSSESHIDG